MTHRIRSGTSRCQCGALVEWEIPTGEWYRGGSYKRFYDQSTHTQHICHLPAEAVAFDWARRWHLDYVPEGVAIPARPTVKPQPEPQPGVQLVRFPIQD